MSVLPDRRPDVTRTLRRAHPLVAEEWTPVPILDEGTIVPGSAMSHVDARAVVGGLSDSDRVELALGFGDQEVTIRHGQTPSPSKSFPERSDPEDGESFVSTWADDDPDDDVYGRVSQLGADAAAVHLSLPFPIRAGTPLTVTARAPVDATLLPVTVLPGTDEEVRTEIRLWCDDNQ